MKNDSLEIRKNVLELMSRYEEAINKIRDGFKLIRDGEKIIKDEFDRHYSVVSRYDDSPDSEIAIKRANCSAWRYFLERMQVSQFISNARDKELKQSLEKLDMPEIGLEEIMQLYKSMADQSKELRFELIKEVYEYLRPAKSISGQKYKTNNKNGKYSLGEKVIIHAMDTTLYRCANRFFVSSYHEQPLTVVDKLFHTLDGKSMSSSYRSPLIDAIETSKDGKGETDYFSFQAYHNGNLHLKFKRMDLVSALNREAGCRSELKGE